MSETYVTGASGFIGKNLVERLDDFVAVPHKEIQTTDFSNAERVFFLSAYGNMAHHHEDEKVLKANITDLVHVLNKVDFQKIKSFVFFSTSSVNLRTQTMYSRTKKAAEEILLSFMEKYNAPITIIRPFSVTGTGEQEMHLIPTLIRSCMNGDQMNFVASPVHDFIDVQDVVDGILTLSERGAKGIFELGTGEGLSNEMVKDIVEEVTGKKANVTYVRQLRNYDNDNWVSRNTKARDMGWLPKKTLKQSIQEMVEAYE